MKNWRYKTLLIIYFSVFLLFVQRLYYWQIRKGQELKIKAEQQRFFSKEIPAKRGEIYTADNYSLVNRISAYLLYADLTKIREEKITEIASKIAKVLYQRLIKVKEELKNEDEGFLLKDKLETKEREIRVYLEEQLKEKNLYWVTLSPKITKEEKEKIEKYNFSGIGFQEIQERYYPESSTAAHLLGFLAKDEKGEDRGYFGLEGFYDRELRGKKGQIFGERDVFGIPILISNFFKRTPQSGFDLYLNINLGVSKIIEEELRRGITTYQAKGGNVVVINPQNGKILGMASFPLYYPAYRSFYKEEIYKNPVVAENFEPGSILKPIIMSIAVNEGEVKPTTRCSKCNGPRIIGGYTIRTFNDKYYPNSTMTEVLEHSDNVGMAYIGELLGKYKLHEYLSNFGFGKMTGIDLQEETSGTLKELKEWYEIDTATVTFGQGIAVTPIQIVQATAALANGGKIYQPYVVSNIKSEEGKNFKIKPKLKKRVLKETTAKILTEMLVSTCEKSPLHYARDSIKELANYRIAAKSGTAQIPLSGKYAEGKTIGSVIGYAPADKPQLLILVKLNEPQADPWGANTAGPIFFKIMRDLLIYYGISP